MGLGEQAGSPNSDGKRLRSSQSLVTISAGNILGSLLGISPVVPYLESGAGISEGGRSGFSSLIVSGLTVSFRPVFAAVCCCTCLCPCTRFDSNRRLDGWWQCVVN